MESDKCLVMCEGYLRETGTESREIEQIRRMMGMRLEDFSRI